MAFTRCRLCKGCGTFQYKDRCSICGYIEVPEVVSYDAYMLCYSANPTLAGKDMRQLYPDHYTPEIQANAKRFLQLVNWLCYTIEISKVEVSSGWRPEPYNVRIGGAKRSKHTQGLAIDIKSPRDKITAWVRENESIMRQNNLAIESPDHTPTWVHIQLGLPRSGKVIFIP